MRYLLSFLLLAPLAAWAQQPAIAPSATSNQVVVEQSGTGGSQARIVQVGRGNVASIRQRNGLDSTGQRTHSITSVQTAGGQTVIDQSQDGHSIFIQQTSPATSVPAKPSGKTTPK